MDWSHLAVAAVGFLLGGIVAQAAEPVVTLVGGCSAMGVALMCAWE